ncbi:LysR substrate-binding domain-containing protein [Serratia ureilytica]
MRCANSSRPGIRAVSTHQPHGASDAAGARAGERDRPGLDNLQSAIDRACRHHQNRPLVISCEPTFLIRWLIPRLAGLQQAVGKERDLQLVSAGGAVAFSREGIDLAIRRNDFPIADDVVARPFLKERVGPVCRREHAAAGRELRGTLLHTETRPYAWRDWCAHSGFEIRPGNELRFEHFYLSLQAAVAGAGIGIGPLALVADDIVNGALVAPYGFAPDGTDYVLMTWPTAGGCDILNGVGLADRHGGRNRTGGIGGRKESVTGKSLRLPRRASGAASGGDYFCSAWLTVSSAFQMRYFTSASFGAYTTIGRRLL